MLKCTVFEIGLKKHHVFFQVCSISPHGRIKTLCVSRLCRKGDIKTHLEANVNALHPVENGGPWCTSAALRLNCALQKQTPAMKINSQYSFAPCVFTEWCLKGSLKGPVKWSWSGKKCVGIAATITRLSVFPAKAHKHLTGELHMMLSLIWAFSIYYKVEQSVRVRVFLDAGFIFLLQKKKVSPGLHFYHDDTHTDRQSACLKHGEYEHTCR